MVLGLSSSVYFAIETEPEKIFMVILRLHNFNKFCTAYLFANLFNKPRKTFVACCYS